MQLQDNKIGVGVLTCNRPEQTKTLLEALGGVHKHSPFDCVVVNDGDKPYEDIIASQTGIPSENFQYVIHGESRRIGRSKNEILDALLGKECRHIFIFEDDVLPIRPDVLSAYIAASKATGILHFDFCCTRGSNKMTYEKVIRGHRIQFYRNPEAGMQYYNGALFNHITRFDESYENAFEHIDLEYQLSQKTLAPPFWFFPDIANSAQYLKYLDCESTLSYVDKDKLAWRRSAEIFTNKFGVFTTQIPTESRNEVDRVLDHLALYYSRPS